MSNPKIIDLIKEKKDGSKPFVSIEFFPPRTETGVKVCCGVACATPVVILSWCRAI